MEEKQSIFEQIREVIAEVLDYSTDKITLDTSLEQDLELNSLELMTIVVELEDIYNEEIAQDELKNLLTVGDVVDYIAFAQENA